MKTNNKQKQKTHTKIKGLKQFTGLKKAIAW